MNLKTETIQFPTSDGEFRLGYREGFQAIQEGSEALAELPVLVREDAMILAWNHVAELTGQEDFAKASVLTSTEMSTIQTLGYLRMHALAQAEHLSKAWNAGLKEGYREGRRNS